MEERQIWVIHFKASMGPMCSINFDASPYIVGIVVVAAPGMRDAVVRMEEILREDDMELLDAWRCERYSSEATLDFVSERGAFQESVRLVEHGSPYQVCAISSEVFEEMDLDAESPVIKRLRAAR